ncbi:MAG: guanylate kinase [Phycisphaera sp.]|nr:guanylate kinase [Phycisphaera sp.]
MPESRTASEPVATPSKQGLLLVMSGPSGVGKTTLVHRLLQRFDGTFSVSATTRPRSAKEVDGQDYYFIDEKTFHRWIEEGRFLEHAEVFGRSRYGTPRNPVESQLQKGRLVVLDIDVQGAIQVRKAMPDSFGVFVLPPDENVLLERLRGRGREDEATIDRRFAEARSEIATADSCGAYDAFVVNDDLERALSELVAIVGDRLAKG